MLNVINTFYHAITTQIVNNQFSLTNILHNIYSPVYKYKNLPADVVKQKCNLLTEYWQQQKSQEFIELVFQLEHLAKNYPLDDAVIIKLLSDFVRNHVTDISPVSQNLTICPEIQAILTVIGSIHRKKDSENAQLDLSYTNLVGANLPQANLESANLYCVNLMGANLSYANLSGVILTAANLCGANLSYANLSGAILGAANFSEANLTGANLSQANLYLANLQQATLDDAILDGANLRETKLGKQSKL
jgi:hypothetical protein